MASDKYICYEYVMYQCTLQCRKCYTKLFVLFLREAQIININDWMPPANEQYHAKTVTSNAT